MVNKFRRQTTVSKLSDDDISEEHEASFQRDNNETSRNDEGIQTNCLPTQEDADVRIRLRLIERQIRDEKVMNTFGFSITAQSVIVSLRWAFLRMLEKPLRKTLRSMASHSNNCLSLCSSIITHSERLQRSCKMSINAFRKMVLSLESPFLLYSPHRNQDQ